MKLSELQATRKAKMDELQGLLDARESASREFTTDEAARFDALEAEVTKLNADIQREEKAENIRKQTVLNKTGKDTPEVKAAKAFSYVRAVQFGAKRMNPDGLEGEMHQEAEKELQRAGVNTGLQGIGIPSFMVNVKGSNVLGQKRDLSSGGSHTGDDWVETMEIGHQYGLEIAPKAFSLGVEVLTGLTGNVYITETGEAAAVWEGENTSADETTPATSKPVNLSPKRLAAFTDLSKTLMVQVSVAEERVRTQLQKALNRKLDQTIFHGTGVSPIPYGIATTTGVITSVSSNGTPSKQTFLDAWSAVVGENAPDNLATVMTPAIYAYLQGAYLDAGSGRFVLENGQITGVGMRAEWSNNITANYILVGDFAQFVVGQWGGVDLIVNPYTKAKENLLELIINANFDMGAYRPKSFVVISDATLA